MADRIGELLAFDLDLIGAIAAGRPIDVREPGADLLLPLDPAVDGPIRLAGFDEAGRGALAGPVAVSCVHFDLPASRAAGTVDLLKELLAGVDDSKRLTAKRRTLLREAIAGSADWGFGCASAIEIDRWGIVAACSLAARRALAGLDSPVDVGLFDRGLSLGTSAERLTLPEVGLTRGDSRSLHIAAASILAKVGRDAIMDRLDRTVSGYGLAKHKGYGTRAHREAIRRLGPSHLHRRSFRVRVEAPESQSC